MLGDISDISSLFPDASSLVVYADSLSKYIYVDTAIHVCTLTLLFITVYDDILYHCGNVLFTQNGLK